MSFTCGFYRKGELVMSWRSIALNYMMSWFLVDLIVVVPVARSTSRQSMGCPFRHLQAMLKLLNDLRCLRTGSRA